jgi:signal transduction histidine kinase
LQDSQLLRIPADAFEQCLRASPDATLAILRTVTARLRNTEALLHQREKMAALGTLAAGLAHELNNPAAAAQRSTAQLQEALAEWLKLTFALIEKGDGEPLAALMERLHSEVLKRSAEPSELDPLGRLEREQSLQAWLEQRGLEDAWQISPALASPGWTPEELEDYGDLVPTVEFPRFIRWLAAGCLAYSLLAEVRQSAGRISQIVKAVKSYTYLDQAPIQQVDVHEGLENTLVMLSHKLKTGVHVVREYAQDLPRVEAYASDLNQVWTNIIDNAIDAMQGQGDLILRTASKDGHVVVEIQDSGPGIPPEIQSRIFDPFFTTKPPGSGSGLGLNIAYDIVVNKHHGEIHLTSQPGATCFQIVLPIHLEENKP